MTVLSGDSFLADAPLDMDRGLQLNTQGVDVAVLREENEKGIDTPGVFNLQPDDLVQVEADQLVTAPSPAKVHDSVARLHLALDLFIAAHRGEGQVVVAPRHARIGEPRLTPEQSEQLVLFGEGLHRTASRSVLAAQSGPL